jgi:type IV pilus assembly protein PilV
MMKTHTPLIRTKQQGATLIEVLVAVLIFSFGLLGLIGLQSRAMQFSGDADGTNRAAALSSEIVSFMNIFRTGDVTAAALVTPYAAWQAKVQTPASGGLPGGTGTVTALGGNPAAFNISIVWTTPSNPLPRRYVTQFVNPVDGGLAAPP